MTSIKVQFEIGHEASIRTKKTPEGFTHDWEVFVRGQDGADISHFVEKVVFYLHETFPKPKRVVREPPFAVKESGYAGFNLPIEIYVKNRDEPKKIRFHYDLNLPQTGPATYNFLKDRYIFENPNEDFKKKLLKGGGIIVSNNAFYTNPDQESRSRDSFTDEKQLMSKPKLSTETMKKHKAKEYKEELPHRNSSFENLFGAPIQKPPKISPEIKKIEKPVAPVKTEKKEKDRSTTEKQKQKHGHKESKPDKVKIKDEREKEKDKLKIEKPSKSHSKEPDRAKEKSNKRPNERPPSPDVIKKKCLSPIRRPPSPPPRSSSASSIKDEYKPKLVPESMEAKKPIKAEIPEIKVEKDSKEKKKKEKKSHERDKERKEKKEHKKESHKPKEPMKEPPKETKEINQAKPTEIQKENVKEQFREKPIKTEKEKPFNKFSIENLRKTPQDTTDRLEEPKKDKVESERKHKHKKKDKKRDESKEKHKESKEKKHKHEKVKETIPDKMEVNERETPLPKERPLLETASPISIDNSSQCSSKSGLQKEMHPGLDDVISALSDSEESAAEDVKIKIENPSPESIKAEPTPEPEPEPPAPEPPQPPKEKSKKHKDKSSRREEKRRKRKAAEEEEENRKVVKLNDMNVKTESESGETSGIIIETKVQDNGVSSSLGEDAEPSDLSPNYMDQLRELQQRIMTIKSNEELDRVVNLIAETGRYEVTTQTFDFDLCLLDRSTVQQLIQLVG